MNVAVLYLANLILLSRLVFTFHDEALSRRQTAVMLLLQGAGLLAYEMTVGVVALAIVLAVIGVLVQVLESRLRRVQEVRLLSLLSYALALNVFFSPWVGLRLSPALPRVAQSLGRYSLVFTLARSADLFEINAVLFGLLLVTNEVNTLVRYQFRLFDLEPKKQAQPDEALSATVDREEYNAGRVIGILERLLIYYLVLNAQFAVIGLVLAAKSFTRFKDLEKRTYAEYVLVGTLSSTLLAMLTAGLVQTLLSG